MNDTPAAHNSDHSPTSNGPNSIVGFGKQREAGSRWPGDRCRFRRSTPTLSRAAARKLPSAHPPDGTVRRGSSRRDRENPMAPPHIPASTLRQQGSFFIYDDDRHANDYSTGFKLPERSEVARSNALTTFALVQLPERCGHDGDGN